MSVLDYILDGLEAELALERELGVRSLELERPLEFGVKESKDRVAQKPQAERVEQKPQVKEEGNKSPRHPFLFLHHRELGPQETEMMTKIVEKLGYSLATTPVVYETPVPKADFYIVLGTRALAKFLPEKHFAYDTWFKTEKGVEMLFTRAPSDILRFKTVTPAIMKIKKDMWNSIKAVAEKLKAI